MFVVESGNGHPKANSYLSVEASEVYANELWGFDQWLPLERPLKEKALKNATRLIDSLNLEGYKKTSDQPLEFPRLATGCLDGECRVCACYFECDEPHVPEVIKLSTFKIAFWLAVQGGTPYDGVVTRSVKRFEMGDTRIEFNDNKEQGIRAECTEDEVTRDWFSLIACDIRCYMRTPSINTFICR